MIGTELQQAKIHRIRQRGSIHDLIGHAERVELVEGRAVVRDLLPAPVDAEGIPRAELMVQAILGQMATRAYVWTGRFDLHHMGTPKADYSVVANSVGANFRGMSMMKIDLPRQMHNLSHALFMTPKVPSVTVMNQALLENEQLRTLHSITMEEFNPDCARQKVDDALETMVDPRVNIMPSRESLAALEIDELRRATGSLIRVRRFTNKSLIHPAVRPTPSLRFQVA